MSLTPEILAQLKQRHLAFLQARLASDEAAAEWKGNVAAAHEALLAAKVGDVVDTPALLAALDAALTSDAVERAARPIAKRLLPVVLSELRDEKGKVGERVPFAAQQKLGQITARPGLVPERVLREIAEQDSIDQMMKDVLYDGFKEFAEKVNPFTAEWGIPSLLKRSSLLGGAMTKGIESVKAEMDRRTEPEIRRFLAGFSRRGLRRFVDAIATGADQPQSVALRRHIVAWVLDQQLAELVREADEETIALGIEIGLDVTAAEFGREATRARWHARVTEALAAVKERTVAEALSDIGVTARVDTDSLAAATWPAVKAVLASAPVKGWIEKLVGEFYDGEIAAAG